MLHPFAEMAGLEVGKGGDIVATYLTKLPEAFKIRPFSSLNAAEKTKRDKFYQRLAKLTGKDVVTLWQTMNYALPSGEWVAAFMGALQPDLDIYQAGAVANYAGGAVRYEGVLGVSDVKQGSSDFLDVNNLLSVGTDQTVRVADALVKLRDVNPGAHEYAVHLIAAKANRNKEQAAIVLAKDTKKVLDTELEIAKKVVTVPLQVAEGALDTAAAAGKAATYLPWIIGGTVAVLAYLSYRNRETIAKLGTAYLTRGVVR